MSSSYNELVDTGTRRPRERRGRVVVDSLSHFACGLLLVSGLMGCAGRSAREDGRDPGGGAVAGEAGTSTRGGSTSSGGVPAGGASAGGVPAGGASAGGVPAGGASAGGASAGTGPEPEARCRQPLAIGSCLAYVPSYWFDASTGVCMPFIYGGCEGNDNRFPTMEECYSECGGQGERDLAACSQSADCMPFRLAEPCCSLDVRMFVGITRSRDPEFSCNAPVFGCTPCAADCDYVPPDGYIGATCDDGHCIPFDARELGGTACTDGSDCYPRYGVECCAVCPSNQYPSKLVALSSSLDLEPIACGGDLSCTPDPCEYQDVSATCVDGTCEISVLLR